MRSFFVRASLSAMLLLPLAACGDDDDPIDIVEPEPSIVEIARSAGSFNTLLTALDVAWLTSVLGGMVRSRSSRRRMPPSTHCRPACWRSFWPIRISLPRS